VEGVSYVFGEDPGMTNSFPLSTVDDFCERNNYSYDMLATELDVSRATIFNWKKDSRGLPRLLFLALKALETNPELRKSPMPDADVLKKQYRRSSHQKLKA
jgi:DNA-binding XRE family transcriptional regulator